MPPRAATTVGMAVATTVDSMAARKIEQHDARGKTRRWDSRSIVQCPPVQPAHLQRARSSAYGYRLCVGICPDHAQPLRQSSMSWGHRLGARERLELRAGAARASAAQAIEGIDAAVIVGPGHPDRVAAHQMDVLGTLGSGWPRSGRSTFRFMRPPAARGRASRMPASR